MKKQPMLTFITLLVLSIGSKAFALEKTSFRMKGLGTQLQWIIDDEYSDFLKNPAAINSLTRRWLLTNLSNQSGDFHQFINPASNYYHAEQGSFLLGMIQNVSGWQTAVIGEYWKDINWQSAHIRMSPSFSDSYGFQWIESGEEGEGSWITDFNNGTETNSDDWRVAENASGARYNSDDSGLEMNLVLGKKHTGFTYVYKRTQSNTPLENLRFATHSYRLMETGSNSPYEAVAAVQEETNVRNHVMQNHTLTMGLNKELKSHTIMDAVISIHFSDIADNSISKNKKKIDFNPDNDNLSYTSNAWSPEYNQYSLQYLETRRGNLSGFGYELNMRYTQILSNQFKLRLAGHVFYQPLANESYLERRQSQEMMTAFDVENAFQNYSDMKLTGTYQQNTTHSLLSLGGTYNGSSKILMGFGLLWYYDLYEDIFNLISTEETLEHDNFREEIIKLHKIALPFGLEYQFNDWQTYRMGVTTNFNYKKQINRVKAFEPSESYSRNINITETDLTSDNVTLYSYGVGLKVTENLQLDFTGITNLTELSNLYLSFVYKY